MSTDAGAAGTLGQHENGSVSPPWSISEARVAEPLTLFSLDDLGGQGVGEWDGEEIDCCTSDDAIFVYGGAFTYNSMGDTARYQGRYDGNGLIGVGHQHFAPACGEFQLGREVGIAARFGNHITAELWAGPALRYDSLTLADCLRMTPSVTAGLSVVSATMGGEFLREEGRDGDVTRLFYRGPEFAVSAARCPWVELAHRLHHRSGWNGTLGNIRDGYNANILGVRFRY